MQQKYVVLKIITSATVTQNKDEVKEFISFSDTPIMM